MLAVNLQNFVWTVTIANIVVEMVSFANQRLMTKR